MTRSLSAISPLYAVQFDLVFISKYNTGWFAPGLVAKLHQFNGAHFDYILR